jgi:urea carboxylase
VGLILTRAAGGGEALITQGMVRSEAVAAFLPARDGAPKVNYRVVGDSYLLVEYGEMILDLNLRIRVFSLQRYLVEKEIRGLLELAPGVRSVLIKYDPLRLPLRKFLRILRKSESELPPSDTMRVPSRVIHLPLAFHDRWTIEAIGKYMQSIRREAPYLPDNVEFVARCNGLEGPDAVLSALLGGYKMVMGLGDVYLGAPCAVPLDPLTRLVVPKYNPARTFTPEGAVGIGGSYMCIYPMESPGGYQLVGRTLPIWNTYQTTPAFEENPWLLRIFDRIRFERVSEGALEDAREAMLAGRYELHTEDGYFDVGEYNRGLASIRDEVEDFKVRQRQFAAQSTEGY